MHELSLLASVVTVVEQAARAAGAKRIRTVALQVGSQSGAIPEALYGSWPIAIAGHDLFGATSSNGVPQAKLNPDSTAATETQASTPAKLQLEEIPATVWCPRCEREVEIDEFFALQCPECGAPTGQIMHGREFNVAWVEWDT